MMKNQKVNLFQKDPALRNRVADFMTKKVWGITLKTRCRQEIEKLQAGIEAQEKLRGSIFANDVDANIAALNLEINRLQTVLAEQLENEANFAWTDNDKKFYKAYKAASTQAQVYRAVQCWFEGYGIITDDTDFIRSIMAAFAGCKKATAKTVIRSEATIFTDEKRSQGDVMALFYGRLSEIMLQKGALKPTAIPEDIREFYAPKKAKKEQK